ncbi:MAG: hypothetical protein PHQ20_04935 [Candidatus Moranbacteria bacterium]|nr:hypothetical protein [Candidatus Moranbacteria bacterium]
MNKFKRAMKEIFKKIFSFEFWQDVAVDFLRFLMKRNPCIFISYLGRLSFLKKNEKRSSFDQYAKSFNQKHPYLSAGSSFVLILAFVFSFTWFLFLKDVQRTAAWPPARRVG